MRGLRGDVSRDKPDNVTLILDFSLCRDVFRGFAVMIPLCMGRFPYLWEARKIRCVTREIPTGFYGVRSCFLSWYETCNYEYIRGVPDCFHGVLIFFQPGTLFSYHVRRRYCSGEEISIITSSRIHATSSEKTQGTANRLARDSS